MNKVALIITSIAGSDCNVLRQYARKSINHNVSFIVVGDKKSPDAFSIDNCDYYSIDRQGNLPLELQKVCLITIMHEKTLVTWWQFQVVQK